MQATWYYSMDGKTREGPITQEALKNMLLQGELPPEILVWSSSLATWTQAQDVKELKIIQPPPLPGESPEIPSEPKVIGVSTSEIPVRGVATISFWAADLIAAKKWYSELLGIDPYFERPDSENPAYIEFRLGDYQHELGIINSNYAPKGAAAGPGGAIVYWHVDDVAATLEKVKAMGATEYEPLTKRGEAGFITASVVDPFGNILGIMYNPHYLEVLNSIRKA